MTNNQNSSISDVNLELFTWYDDTVRYPIHTLATKDFPTLLHEIPEPPTSLNYRGTLPPTHLRLLSIVGSRKYTSYGKQVVEELVSGLSGYPIGIISGLALGIDSLAHEAALKNDLYTLAIPGGGLEDDVLYPATHKRLAHRILDAGGGLLSEFEPTFKATRWSFPQRNRLVAGISHATLLIEAAERSGTLITARMATDYNRELLVVPGSIFSSNSTGVHQFLKLGAVPVTTPKDILEALHIEVNDPGPGASPSLSETNSPEAKVLALLKEPLQRDELIRCLNMDTTVASQLLMMMELNGHIIPYQNGYRRTTH
jgi:DNA processing protein